MGLKPMTFHQLRARVSFNHEWTTKDSHLLSFTTIVMSRINLNLLSGLILGRESFIDTQIFLEDLSQGNNSAVLIM